MYGALAGALLGSILGLLPLILGIVKGKAKLGIIGWITSILGGAIFILFSVIPVAVFTWMILKRTPGKVSTETKDTPGNTEP